MTNADDTRRLEGSHRRTWRGDKLLTEIYDGGRWVELQHIADRPRLPRMPPVVRVTATYPATDGRAPETVEVVWETAFPDPAVLSLVIAALAAVTKDRL